MRTKRILLAAVAAALLAGSLSACGKTEEDAASQTACITLENGEQVYIDLKTGERVGESAEAQAGQKSFEADAVETAAYGYETEAVETEGYAYETEVPDEDRDDGGTPSAEPESVFGAPCYGPAQGSAQPGPLDATSIRRLADGDGYIYGIGLEDIDGFVLKNTSGNTFRLARFDENGVDYEGLTDSPDWEYLAYDANVFSLSNWRGATTFRLTHAEPDGSFAVFQQDPDGDYMALASKETIARAVRTVETRYEDYNALTSAEGMIRLMRDSMG